MVIAKKMIIVSVICHDDGWYRYGDAVSSAMQHDVMGWVAVRQYVKCYPYVYNLVGPTTNLPFGDWFIAPIYIHLY